MHRYIYLVLTTIILSLFFAPFFPVYAAPSVNVGPNPVQPGQTFNVHVQGCTANTSVVINYTDPSNNQGNIASLQSGSDGSAAAQSRLTTEGGYLIHAFCNNLRDSVTLEVKSPPAAAPNKPFPPNVSMVTSRTAQLTWAAVSGATSYQVWFQKTGSSGEQPAGTANGTSFHLIDLDPDSHYSVWINGCGNADCSVRSPASDKETFSTLSAPGGAPPPPLPPPPDPPPPPAAPIVGGKSGNSLTDLRSILNNDPFGQTQRFGNLGGLVTALLNIVFLIAGVLMFIWAFVGIFQYITAGGNKEGLAKARARVTWAIIGFIFVVAAFSMSLYVQQLIQPKDVNIPRVTP